MTNRQTVHTPEHLTSPHGRFGPSVCREARCKWAVKIDPATGRFYITMGHPGFNTRANNGAGYATERGARRAFRSLSGGPARLRGRFEECEHSGDLERYAQDVAKAGGRIVWSQVDGEVEVGTVEVEVGDAEAFVAAFRKTESAGFGHFVRIEEVRS